MYICITVSMRPGHQSFPRSAFMETQCVFLSTCAHDVRRPMGETMRQRRRGGGGGERDQRTRHYCAKSREVEGGLLIGTATDCLQIARGTNQRGTPTPLGGEWATANSDDGTTQGLRTTSSEKPCFVSCGTQKWCRDCLSRTGLCGRVLRRGIPKSSYQSSRHTLKSAHLNDTTRKK